ncbi:MAG: hypothetical protein HYW71_01370 [Candidatus Niyogibacteria bacterium]|nr:hypothetical protein [Candidatus Niyogibacteria bacterium]
MSFLEKLEEIQNKPEPERKKILAVSLIIGMILITAIWLINFRYSIKTTEKTKDGDNEMLKPLSLIFSGVKNSAAELKNNIKEKLGKISNFSVEPIIYESR